MRICCLNGAFQNHLCQIQRTALPVSLYVLVWPALPHQLSARGMFCKSGPWSCWMCTLWPFGWCHVAWYLQSFFPQYSQRWNCHVCFSGPGRRYRLRRWSYPCRFHFRTGRRQYEDWNLIRYDLSTVPHIYTFIFNEKQARRLTRRFLLSTLVIALVTAFVLCFTGIHIHSDILSFPRIFQ